eukprot:2026561-Alexandrium_andersonii.AAC.1
MREAARAEGPSHVSHSIALEARPADDSGAPIGSACRYAPAVSVEPEGVVQGGQLRSPPVHPPGRSVGPPCPADSLGRGGSRPALAPLILRALAGRSALP